MSRRVYTYTDLTKITDNPYFEELAKYPIITVSADLRKGFIGSVGIERKDEVISYSGKLNITEFRNITTGINRLWTSDQAKFNETIVLSEFLRNKTNAAKDEKELNWLTGCSRNIDSLLSAINLLVEAEIEPEQLNGEGDRNLQLLIEAWKYLEKRDSSISNYKKQMAKMTSKDEWEKVFLQAFNIGGLSEATAIVFHGFYYITPIQEHVMRLMEKAGYELIYFIPYDERFPFAYEIWDKYYSEENGYVPKSQWKIEKSDEYDAYGLLFEGEEQVSIENNLEIKEYATVMEFVDDVKRIKSEDFTMYAANQRDVNEMLKDYFPDEYGERKILAYPIGQFISSLNKMWDEEQQTISLDTDSLIDCFASGWLSVNGVSGKQYMQDLLHLIPFFRDCNTIEQWEQRIGRLKEIRTEVLEPFNVELDVDPAISRWQEAIANPFDNFGMFSVEPEKLDVILALINQLLDMAKELFGNNGNIKVNEHLGKLNNILKRSEISNELYEEERVIVQDIFEKLNQSNSYIAECSPVDIARALDLFICGRFDDSEIETSRVGFVRPLFFVEAEAVKNYSKAHICMCDINTIPGGNKDYIWPLTKGKILECYEKTKNPLISNMIQIMDATVLCNRYFMYAALKNKSVCLSWISEMSEKLLAPSPYLKLIAKATGIEIEPSTRDSITFNRVWQTPEGKGKIEKYDRDKAPRGIIKEARMAYALCPMKYTISYVLEKYPTYDSDFQQSYALNALISAIYNLMKEQGMKVDEVYRNVMELFPTLRKSEKRQVYDYISYDNGENDFDYGNRTQCGGKYYTDERIKIHYPNHFVREATKNRFGKLVTPDGRTGLDLYEKLKASPEEMIGDFDPVQLACSFCPHVSYCRNAIYEVDQENYYD
ncbi:hypothetical protein [Pseudobutyrivibrio ruminis]|uniref:hypothetical protein n=1 Tax=Pseudobutyrivibrio ruminis TaxID=46206 RepID=UPI00040A06E3|nr:hypothetical protein [Pseudobutyrivibrio ruminis]